MRLLLAGNGLAQALQFGAVFILVRIYEPQDFGILAQVQSIATLAVVVGTLQLHLTIPLLSRNLDMAREVTVKIESLCFFVLLVSLPFAIWLGGITIFVAFVALGVGLSNTYSAYLVYEGRFSSLSTFYVVRAVLIIAMQLLFAVVEMSNGILWATVIGEGVAAASLRLMSLGLMPIYINPREILSLIIRNKSFSLYGTLQELISVLAFYVPLLFFTYRFGDNIAGHYAMANRLIWGPVVLLSGSVAQVLYHRFGQSPPDTLARLWDLGYGRCIFGGTLLVIGFSFFLEDMYLWILGEQWELASQLLPLHFTWGCIFLLSMPFRVSCLVMKLQKIQLWIDTIMFLVISVLFMFLEITPLQIMWGIVLIALIQNIALALTICLSLRGRCAAGVSP